MTSEKPTTLQKMNPMLWRQSRQVKKAVLTVDEAVADMTKNAVFLENTATTHDLAAFYRSEIQIGKVLGEGSFSQVYEITAIQCKATVEAKEVTYKEDVTRKELQAATKKDKEEKKPCRYAIKLVKRDLLRKPYEYGTAIADMVVEAKYLTRMDHPNIMKVRGLPIGGTAAFQSGKFDSFFLVTDRLVDTLEQKIEQWQREGPPDPKQIPRKTNYALQVANALYYLHQRRIIFRDLKPSNIGFYSDQAVKLFDFGLCRELPQGFDNELYAMSGAGSQWYMAVEIFLTGKYNLKADVYSWAMTYYECLTESKPFAKLTKLQHVAMVCVKGRRPKLSHYDLPHHLRAVLRDAWAQSVSHRPTMHEVIKELEAMLPEMGDEDACRWPTVEHTSVQDQGQLIVDGARAKSDDDIEALMVGADDMIDEEIFIEMKKSGKGTQNEVDDNDFSFSQLCFSEH